jgi:hypothetical protein
VYGEWGGIVFTTVLGGVQGVRAAGVKIPKVTEFSHWLPARYFRPGGPSYKPLLTRAFGWAEKTVLNGNFVSRARHYYHDPFRYPRGWQALGEKWPAVLQQLDRIPNLFKGAAAGAAAGSTGAALAGDRCGCRR